jgi:hypothetical protein
MTKSSIAAKVLPVAIVAVVLGASLLMRPAALSLVNTAFCGSGYGYGTQPAVDGISPTGGPASGGTVVTITGCGFTGATAVQFGATPATTFTVNSDTQMHATSPAHAAGTVDVTVTTPLGTSPTSSADQFSYSGQCTAVSLTASPPSGQPSGTQVTLTAVGTCPNPNPSYEFWARWAGTSTWVLLQGYSTTNTYVWNSTGAPAGTENFGVWVRDASSGAAYDAITSIPYTVTGPTPTGCTAVSVSPSPASVNEGDGTHVTLTASSTCPHASPKYEFWAKWQGTSTWQLLQSYSLSNTYDWNSAGALPGTETFGVWVKDAQSSNQYDIVNNTTVTVAKATCAAVTIVAVPTTVVHGSGTHVMLTATATGCTNSTGQQYEFWMRPAFSSVWLKVQSYSANDTYDWNSTGAAAGQINFGVWAKDKNSSNTYDVFNNTTVTVS